MDVFRKKLLASLVAIGLIAAAFTGLVVSTERAEATDGCLLWEDFEGSFPPTGWTIIQYIGNGTWEQEAYRASSYWSEPPGMGSYFAWADSDEHRDDLFDTGLFTPSIDCSGCDNIRLTFARNFQECMGCGYAEVNTYSGGIAPGNLEENLWNQTVGDPHYGVHTTLFFDPSGYADPSDVYIEFYYTTDGGKDCWSFAIDAVEFQCLISPPVGGEAYPVDKISLLAPWITVGVLLAGGIGWYVLRRRRAQS
jgi:hypothetical protein